MRTYSDQLLHSPSDLVRFLACRHATALDLLRLHDPDALPEQADDDELAKRVQQQGLDHEDAYRAGLEAKGGLVEIATDRTLKERARATAEAMREGAPAIFQATFYDPPWHGFADFLIRVETPSDLGPWSYEPVDTKLARSVKPSYIVQLGLYAQMMAKVQGVMSRRVHVALGSGETESFRLAEFAYTLEAAQARYLGFIDAEAAGSTPEPCSACGLCGWREHCDAVWQEADHLSFVAGLGMPQRLKLEADGITTLAQLATADPDHRVPRMARETFAKLREQAILQLERRAGGEAKVVTLPVEDGRGFTQLPPPDPADLFFDLEGDPLTQGGLEYLWGIHYRDGTRPEFRFRWGHDHVAERVAFESTVDWMVAHLASNPGAHIYHYAPYEVTALRRLSTLHASREDAVDKLLRERRLVDLYGVLRQSIRTSEPNLSLKTMEIFFAPKRAENVANAADSIIEYKNWQDTGGENGGDQAILDDILAYNKVDCENTEALRDWLISLRPDDLPWRSVGPAKAMEAEQSEAALEAQAAAEALIEAIHAGPLPPSKEGRELVAHLTQFHRRADKPAYWSMFDRAEADPDDLVEEGECIGAIRPLPSPEHEGQWQWPEKQSTVARYSFPPQDTKMRKGTQVLHAPTLAPLGAIQEIDTRRGVLTLKRKLKPGEAFPEAGSLISGAPINTSALRDAVKRVAGAWAAGKQRYTALLDLIARTPPRLHDWSGGPMVREGETLVDATALRCLALDDSTLFVQGPPGTGKTYTSAHAILALIAAGKRVGVSSNSHKAINNLLAKVEEVALETGQTFSGVKKATKNNAETELDGAIITDVYSNSDVIDCHPDLVGGTAWLFASEDMDQTLDYLFVDEAGQVSLGHLLAMGASARNIVLVGDQMQLGQPVQGAHPGESGLSALDYLLEGEATVAPDRGILLDTSWRMHPEICDFISSAVYDGRLKPLPACANQTLQLEDGHDPALAPHGIRFLEQHHKDCGQRSDEEALRVRDLCEGLIGTPFINRAGEPGRIDWKNILIVAPYNMQVNALQDALPAAARVGTVDKFQGQEAEVVIVSLTTSSPDDLPRHVDFFYSKNRLNVAISRARTLALVLANPRLLELDAKSVEHLRLVNTLAHVAKEGM
ncbi:TM0106 family RecB-like putative nuclease [Novosphingobium decolorationis]|uniref:TM0106 family RecB-like putative nuclease n=1 Tax=Novosphingobium decolorationis TaxID=2698673 RepID=A0ABX8E7M7_9SPHN|nr:TM0106 family RecB-like putative nuclease [Novosphingobium decolorationis]QVM85185.1 TM0106 family RecB-like putative nuclease [Novosphingobium decolorationis]